MIINGTAYWAKIVGEPQTGYDKTQKEWSLDLGNLTDETVAKLEEVGLGPKIKRDEKRGAYISFKRKSLKKDPTTGNMIPAKPIKIVDAHKRDWDGKTLIGNGSELNVSFVVNETEYNKKKFKKPGVIAVQVVKLVEYEGGDREEFPEYNDDSDGWSED